MTKPTIFDPAKHSHLVHRFVAIHQACITHDFTLATFLPPLCPDAMLAWWEARVDEVRAGTRTIIFAETPLMDALGTIVAGVVTLCKPPSETGPFRGVVEKLLVDLSFRRRGVATALMVKLEGVPRTEGRPLLIGNIPNYGISPKDGRLVEEIFFYKDLRATE